MLYELIYHAWRVFEKFMAWWQQHEKGGDIVREVWIYKRECAQGSLGLPLDYRPNRGLPSRLLRLLELVAWYSPPGQLVVWRTKKGDW